MTLHLLALSGSARFPCVCPADMSRHDAAAWRQFAVVGVCTAVVSTHFCSPATAGMKMRLCPSKPRSRSLRARTCGRLYRTRCAGDVCCKHHVCDHRICLHRFECCTTCSTSSLMVTQEGFCRYNTGCRCVQSGGHATDWPHTTSSQRACFELC